MIVKKILQASDIPARRVTLNGHMVTEALIDKSKRTWWVLDSDFGVVIEYDVKTLSKKPELVEKYYKAAGYSAAIAKWASDVYAPYGNYVITDYHQCQTEEQYYRLKWQIPVFLLLPYPLIILTLKYFSSRRRLSSSDGNNV